MAEEQLDYGEDEFGSSQKMQYHGDGAIPALADDEIGGEDDEYDDLYNDVNVGEGFLQMQRSESQPSNQVKGNGTFHDQKVNIQEPRSEPMVPLSQDTTININTNIPKEGNNMSIDLLQKRPAPLPDTQIPFRGSPKPEPPVNEPPPMQNPNPGQQMVTRPVESQSRPPVENGATMLFVGELHWWTTDAELESVLTQYGRVKEIKFFDERASGKSKGYCQVEFLESSSAAACKEGMNGYLFNGRPCVVAFASPQTIKQMGANKNQGPVQSQEPARRPINEGGRGANFGRGNFGRGGGIGRGANNNMRGGGRGGMGPKNNNAGGPGFYGGPGFAGPPGGFMHPGGFPGGGFDPGYMGRGGYGAMMPNFPGMMPNFPIAGVAPHVNPAFFNRGMGGMMEGPQWGDTGVGQWGGEDVGQRTRESSYGGEDGGSEYGYTENEKGGQSQRSKEREREWSGNSEKRHREEREYEKDYKYNKEDKDNYREHRQKDRSSGHDEEWDRGQSSSRSRAVPEEDHHRSRSRDADYGKRRRSMRD